MAGIPEKNGHRQLSKPELTESNIKSTQLNGAPTSSMSRSSTSGSSMSLDDVVMQQNKENKKVNANCKIENDISLNDLKKNSKVSIRTSSVPRKSSTFPRQSMSMDITSGGRSIVESPSQQFQIADSSASNLKAKNTSTMSSYGRYNKNVSLNTSSSRALTKDKKAARSLFILVFVFGFCWV